MMERQLKNPLHGITLEMLLADLVNAYGWEALGQRIPVRCFTHDPSSTSSLKFLRRTPWARERVEQLYIDWQTSGKSQSLRSCIKQGLLSGPAKARTNEDEGELLAIARGDKK